MKLPKLVKTELDGQIAELVGSTNHQTAVIWACDCAQRVLAYFEEMYPEDDRPRLAIAAGRAWASTGVFRMADIRQASLDSHTAARDAQDYSAARSAARAAGQAVAAAHVAGHAVVAAIYAATAVRDSVPAGDLESAVTHERQWQYQHLRELHDVTPRR